jgi:hypothetical protein
MPFFKKGRTLRKCLRDRVYCMIYCANKKFPTLECCEVVQQGVDKFQRLHVLFFITFTKRCANL